jgi:hypothetical protein
MAGSGLFSDQVPQRAHILAGQGKGREIRDLRDDVAETLAPLAALTVIEFTNPPAAAATAIRTSNATAVTAQIYTGAALNGSIGSGQLPPAGRNVTVTATDNSGAGGYTGSVTFLGTRLGAAQTETVAISDNATVAGTKIFDTVTRISVPAQPDTSGALSFGYGALLGLEKMPKSRAGLAKAVLEISSGAAVTTGVLSAVNGSYAPAAAPDGSRDYAVYYEYVL